MLVRGGRGSGCEGKEEGGREEGRKGKEGKKRKKRVKKKGRMRGTRGKKNGTCLPVIKEGCAEQRSKKG